MDKNWKEQLKERFSGFTLPEPEGLWEGIEKELPAPKARIAPFWWWGSAAVAAAAAGAVVFLHPFQVQQQPDPVNGNPVAVVTDTIPEVPTEPEETEAVPEDNVAPIAVQVKRMQSRMAAVVDIPATTPSVTETEHTQEQEQSQKQEQEQVQVQEEKQEQETVTEQTDNSGEGTLPLILPNTPEPRKAFRPSLSLGVEGSGAFGNSTVSGERYPMAPVYSVQGADGKQPSGTTLVRMVSAGKESDYEDYHQAPLRFGLSLKGHFTPHWAVETGAMVSLLRSSFHESNRIAEQETLQTVYMLGVPLKFSWGFQPVKSLNVYAAAGAMGEKCLGGSSVTYTTLGGASDKRLTEENPLDKSGLYWSAGIDLGAEWRITNWIGLYAEPGLWYHFPAGTELSTIYSVHPLSVSLTAGLRFHLGK